MDGVVEVVLLLDCIEEVCVGRRGSVAEVFDDPQTLFNLFSRECVFNE